MSLVPGCIDNCNSEPDVTNPNCRQCLETSLREFYEAEGRVTLGYVDGLRRAAEMCRGNVEAAGVWGGAVLNVMADAIEDEADAEEGAK